MGLYYEFCGKNLRKNIKVVRNPGAKKINGRRSYHQWLRAPGKWYQNFAGT